MKTTAFVLMMLLSGVVLGQQKPTTGYAPVNGLKMYYEIHGSGEPVVLLHGAFMAITDDWRVWINELAKTRKVIAVEMQGHGRTADIKRDITYENLADDVAGLLDHLKIPNADIVGYSLGGGVAMQCAIRHPEKVRKVVSISASFRRDGWVKEANDFWPNFTWEMMKGTPAEVGYKKLNPNPNGFPDFFNHIKATALRPYDFGADKLKATKAADVLHPRRRRRRAARSHRGNVPPQGRRSTRRHAAASGIETGHFARHHTRNPNEPHDNDRPDGERLSRCEAPKVIDLIRSVG